MTIFTFDHYGLNSAIASAWSGFFRIFSWVGRRVVGRWRWGVVNLRTERALMIRLMGELGLASWWTCVAGECYCMSIGVGCVVPLSLKSSGKRKISIPSPPSLYYSSRPQDVQCPYLSPRRFHGVAYPNIYSSFHFLFFFYPFSNRWFACPYSPIV